MKLSNSKDPKVKSTRILEPLFGGINRLDGALLQENSKSGLVIDQQNGIE